MNRAIPADLRKSLPMPVINEEDKAAQVAELQRRLDLIEKEQ